MKTVDTPPASDSLARQAYDALEQMIVMLRLAPGALVTEKQLIEIAGHGRTPVREAIQKLEWQGLMLVRPRVGLQVAEIAAGDAADIMAVRRRLEPLAASLVATHADERQRTRLVDCARDMTTAAATADMAGFLAADKRFDDIVDEACTNRFITSALAPLRSHSRRLWFSTADIEAMDRSVGLHVGVIRAIGRQDAAGAAVATEKLLDDLIRSS
ncbi:DNA-binding GntR family transcriptional regulator [Neorhizobium galegae]|uniref:GntR family transcriptional regulator n=1 Tax=Neorhizobium galegae TaxID=399 RepID=UPI001AEB7AEE|nr:GntR family transcriptional regulator [Neorhizobium galegae]MBP2549605.1 DNA-binding GntR family transcriptional regulator [Neorhizobium galegae]